MTQRVIGVAVDRIEDPRFLTGRGMYVDDLPAAGTLEAVIFRSPIAHGKIASLDVSAAKAAPGVVDVLTAASLRGDVPLIPFRLAPFKEFEPCKQPVIARDRVRYVGEPIAIVIASTRALAEDAAELIEIDFDEFEPIVDRYAAERAATTLFEAPAGNLPLNYTTRLGDPESAFAQADYVRTETFRTQRHTALPLETRGLIAAEADGRLVVSGAAKVPFFNRRVLAQMLGRPVSSIDLIEVDVGAGFGVRGEFYPEDFLIPFAALTLGRSVRWIEDRREHMMAINHSRDIECELSIACRRDGTLLAIRGKVYGDMGAYIRTNGGVVPAKAAQFLPGPYRIPNVEVEVTAFMTNKTPVGTYRGPGRFEANFFRERLLDIVADDLSLDPAEFRRRNLITQNELPWSIGTLVPYETPTEYDTGNYPAAFERALQEIGWAEKKSQQGALINGRRHGIGLACFVESGGAGPKENARIDVDQNGKVIVSVGSSVLGQGLETVLAQIAAETLGVSIVAIEVKHGSTTLLDEGFGTYHSRAVVMGGSAVLDAATKLRAQATELAIKHLGWPNLPCVIDNGVVSAPDGASISFGELAAIEPLTASGTFANTVRTYSYGAHAAHVAVDVRTGGVEVLDYIAVEDVGRVINPAIVHGQAIGAIVQGLGGVFLDHILYDEQGQLLNASLAEYLVPTSTDFPKVRAVTLELCRSKTNPLGAKGAGEGGIVAVAGATANAVAAALRPLGVSLHELPLTPPRIWQAIADAAKTREKAC